jgi:hypothetical protein
MLSPPSGFKSELIKNPAWCQQQASETSVDFQRTKQSYKPENYRYENLKLYIIHKVFKTDMCI